MGEYLAPGVFVEEISGPRPIEGVGTAVAAFVGITSKGKPGVPYFISNFGDYMRKFGSYRDDAYTPFVVNSYFNEGGTKAYVVRHIESAIRSQVQSLNVSIPQQNSIPLRLNFGDVDTGNSRRVQVSISNVTEGSPGTFDVRIVNDSTVSSYNSINLDPQSPGYLGAISGVIVESNRPANGTYSLTGGSQSVGASVSIPIQGNISEIAFTITYLTAGEEGNSITVTISEGSSVNRFNMLIDTGLEQITINDNSLIENDTIAFIGNKTIEGFSLSNISASVFSSPVEGDYNASVQNTIESIAFTDILNAAGTSIAFSINSTSIGRWGNSIGVGLQKATNSINENFNLTVYEISIINGTKNYTPVEIYENLSLDTADKAFYIINAINNKSALIEISNVENEAVPEKNTIYQLYGGVDDEYPVNMVNLINNGITNLDKVDGITMLVCPEIQGAADHRSAADYCERRKDCFYIGSVLSTDKSVTDIKGKRTDYGTASRSALYAPWIKIIDPRNGTKKAIPPTGAIAGIYSRTDINRGVYKAPAGTLDGVLKSAVDLTDEITAGEQQELNPIGVNCIRNIPGAGIVCWGCRTLSIDAQWRYVNIRRILIYIEKSIEKGIAWAVFEPNNFKLWSALRRDISGFLRVLWRDGGLFGVKEEDAFFVKIDEENNPPESRDLGRLIINVGVAPIKPAEFVIIRLEQLMQKI